MQQFDRFNLQILPLGSRESKSSITEIGVNPSSPPPEYPCERKTLRHIAEAILHARQNGRPVILAYGAHLIKNGLGPALRRMVERRLVTHFATNGAGSIHDWEFAYLGRSEEDVRKYIAVGQFGLWEETGRYINLALLLGASRGMGYGEAVGALIHEESLRIPSLPELTCQINAVMAGPSPGETLGGLADLYSFLREDGPKLGIGSGRLSVNHPYKAYSIQQAAYAAGIPLTIHPGLGYDIIHTSPVSRFSAIGRAAQVDFLRYASSIADLEGGVYLSIGSAIMSPMIFEKSLSMARNVARQKGARIADFLIVINDLQEAGDWQWGSGIEPPKDNPAYYARLCKTFDRMGAREMHYVHADNRAFLLNLIAMLEDGENAPGVLP